MDDNTAIADMSDEMLEKTFRINTFGLMYGLREECRQYLSQGDGGVIVNVCSVGATHQTAGAAYCASCSGGDKEHGVHVHGGRHPLQCPLPRRRCD